MADARRAPLDRSELDRPYALSAEHIAQYRRDGFIRLGDVLSPGILAHYGAEISRVVAERSSWYKPLAERDTYGKAFLQVINIWTQNAMIAELVRSPRLARIAAELMGTRGTRIYHDQALYKEPGGGMTPWHADQRHWPLASDHSVTAWIPLQAVPIEMGPLAFAAGSQHLVQRRKELGLEIGDESERVIARSLTDCRKVEEPYALGDVSFHGGWTFHRAGPNTTSRQREIMTIIYMDADMILGEPWNAAQTAALESMFQGLKPGDAAATALNPVVWER